MRKDLKNRVILFFCLGFLLLPQNIVYMYIDNEILYLPWIFLGIFMIIYGAFLLLRRYINVLRLITAILIIIMWITYFTLPIPSIVNPLVGYILIVIITIGIILLTYSTPKEWKKYKKIHQKK